MDLFQVSDTVEIITPDENAFGIDSFWLLAMIVGLILIFQVIKFFFEIGERYVVTVILVVLAPLAFGMGGSKNTEDIFKGWCRMFGSMCVMMLMNVIFLKLLLSTMSTVPSDLGIFPWLIFVTAIVRVGRKIDDIVCRDGAEPRPYRKPPGAWLYGPSHYDGEPRRPYRDTDGGRQPHRGRENTLLRQPEHQPPQQRLRGSGAEPNPFFSATCRWRNRRLCSGQNGRPNCSYGWYTAYRDNAKSPQSRDCTCSSSKFGNTPEPAGGICSGQRDNPGGPGAHKAAPGTGKGVYAAFCRWSFWTGRRKGQRVCASKPIGGWYTWTAGSAPKPRQSFPPGSGGKTPCGYFCPPSCFWE